MFNTDEIFSPRYFQSELVESVDIEPVVTEGHLPFQLGHVFLLDLY